MQAIYILRKDYRCIIGIVSSQKIKNIKNNIKNASAYYLRPLYNSFELFTCRGLQR